MNVEKKISFKIEGEFEPVHYELLNESHMHSGSATESHFNLLLVSQVFSSLKKVQRHQIVYKLLNEELEWAVSGAGIIKSPNCEGKNT